MNATSEVRILWGAEVRRTLRSGRGLALLILYTLFSMMTLGVIQFFASLAQKGLNEQAAAAGASPEQAAQAMEQAMQQTRSPVIAMLMDDDPALVEALTRLPLTVLLVFKITLFFLPLYVALMGFDQLSGEVGPRSVRYVTVRARRSSLLFGKLLSQATVLTGLVVVVNLGVFLVVKLVSPDFTWGAFGVGLTRFWLAATVFSFAYVALTTLCSSLTRAPGLSLMLNVLALFGLWVVHLIGSAAHAASERGPLYQLGGYLRFASPSHYSNGLLHPHALPFFMSVAVYALFAALFVGSAWAVLRARDL